MSAYIWTLRLTGESSVTDHFLKGVVVIFFTLIEFSAFNANIERMGWTNAE